MSVETPRGIFRRDIEARHFGAKKQYDEDQQGVDSPHGE